MFLSGMNQIVGDREYRQSDVTMQKFPKYIIKINGGVYMAVGLQNLRLTFM